MLNLFSLVWHMMKTNIKILDLENDILNMMGDYVKQDNKKRIRKEK